MPRRDPFLKGDYLHVFNRGLNKQRLFYNDDDYSYFLKLFFKHLKRYHAIELLDFCLLPNHFHFVFLNKRYGFSISRLISKVFAGYSKYYERHCGKERGKKLLEGPFKANVLDTESYYNRCRFYVRHNAVKHGLVDNISDRKYTSYHNTSHNERENNPKLVINRFSQHLDLHVDNEWLDKKDNTEET